MLRAFGTIIAKLIYIVKPYHIVVLFTCVLLLCKLAYHRIKVVTLFITDIKQPSHMVYTGYKLRPYRLVGYTERFKKR